MNNFYRKNVLAAFIVLWCLGNTNLVAQQESPTAETTQITVTNTTPEISDIDKVRILINGTENNNELDETVRTKLIEQYKIYNNNYLQ